MNLSATHNGEEVTIVSIFSSTNGRFDSSILAAYIDRFGKIRTDDIDRFTVDNSRTFQA